MTREDDVFAGALETPPGKRATFLDRACAGDVELRARVDALLDGSEEAGGSLAAPLSARCAVVPEEKPGDRIGRYTLIEKIGEGGCGVVWRAEQREPVRREVALKVIKLGMDTR